MAKKYWTLEKIAELVERYPTTPNDVLMTDYGVTALRLRKLAYKLKLKKAGEEHLPRVDLVLRDPPCDQCDKKTTCRAEKLACRAFYDFVRVGDWGRIEGEPTEEFYKAVFCDEDTQQDDDDTDGQTDPLCTQQPDTLGGPSFTDCRVN